MKTIGIAEFKTLVKECLTNPGSFAGKSIVLWNEGHMQYGMPYRIIEECCVEHNKNHADDQVWFTYSDTTFKTDEISTLRALCERKDMYGFKTRGILFNTGCYFPADEADAWLEFINTHKNKKGLLSSDWVLIACAYHGYDKYSVIEDQFTDNCDIYSLQPSLEEWTEWVAQYNSPEVLNTVRAFIEENSPAISFDHWQRIMEELDRELGFNDFKSLKQIPKEDLDHLLRSSYAFLNPDFPFEAFENFIQSR
jgi:hypothetical protein